MTRGRATFSDINVLKRALFVVNETLLREKTLPADQRRYPETPAGLVAILRATTDPLFTRLADSLDATLEGRDGGAVTDVLMIVKLRAVLGRPTDQAGYAWPAALANARLALLLPAIRMRRPDGIPPVVGTDEERKAAAAKQTEILHRDLEEVEKQALTGTPGSPSMRSRVQKEAPDYLARMTPSGGSLPGTAGVAREDLGMMVMMERLSRELDVELDFLTCDIAAGLAAADTWVASDVGMYHAPTSAQVTRTDKPQAHRLLEYSEAVGKFAAQKEKKARAAQVPTGTANWKLPARAQATSPRHDRAR